jgi:3-dehydroquinate dehydratase-2
VRKILVLNGPNLNLLGTREPELYGAATLDQIIDEVTAFGAEHGCAITATQSNSEGGLIDALHEARGWADGAVLNAGGYTHTSVAVRDAVAAVGYPVVETHLSNVHARESFRHVSLLAPVCVGVVSGFGAASYRVALLGLLSALPTTD